MTTCFNYAPLKIQIKDMITREIKKIYYIFTFLPDNIKSILNKLNRKKPLTSSDISGLEKYFGNKWKKLIEYDEFKGGDEFEDEDFDFGEEETNYTLNQDELKEVDYSNFKHYETETEIYPDDTFFEFKTKIYYITNIPVYRQFLTYTDNPKAVPIYIIFINDYEFNINIDIKKNNTNVAGVPIDKLLADKYEEIKVRAFDDLLLIDDHISQSYDLYDLDFLRQKMNIEVLKNDKYQMKLVYYGLIKKYYPIMTFNMFSEYLENESIVLSKYPLINKTKKYLKERYDSQTEIVKRAYSRIEENKKFFDLNITNNVNSFKYRFNKKNTTSILFIRSIIDILQTNDFILIVTISIQDGNYVISKYNKSVSIDEVTEFNNRYLDDDLEKNIYIRYEFNEILHMFSVSDTGDISGEIYSDSADKNFKDILKDHLPMINGLIKSINSSEIVFKSNYVEKIQTATLSNIYLESINTEYKWKKSINRENFLELEPIINKFITAGILVTRNNIYSKTSESHLLRFIRGVRKEIKPFIIKKDAEHSNYYMIYIDQNQKNIWDNRNVGCMMNIVNNTTYISFEITEINHNSFIKSNKYLIELIRYMDDVSFKGVYKNNKLNTKKKMEELDPDLYDFETKEGIKYSRICQKKFRPINVYTEEEYKTLDKTGKNIYKFINYTTNKDIYYECGNKFKVLGFITGKHPNNYCIPKCKITETEGNKNKKIKSLCMEKHKLKEEDIDNISTTNVIKFGKLIPHDRYSYAHELFYKEFSIKNEQNYLLYNDGYEGEEEIDYYIYYYCMKKGITVKMFINDLIKKIKNINWDEKFKNIFDIESIISSLNKLNSGKYNINWIEIFPSLIYIVYNDVIITIDTIILDPKEILNKENSSIKVIINNITNINELNDIMIFFKLKNNIYPLVHSRNIKLKYSNKFIENIKEFKKKKDKFIYVNYPFNFYTKLVDNKKINIKKIYINGPYISNIIAEYKNNNISLGVYNSSINLISEDTEKIYEPMNRKKYNLPFNSLMEFIEEENIDLTNALLLCDADIIKFKTKEDKKLCNFIGFRIKDEYFWFNDTKIDEVTKYITKIKIEFLPYNIEEVNKSLLTKNIDSSIIPFKDKLNTFYHMNIYNLLKKEVFRVLSKYKNKDVHKKIKSIIKTTEVEKYLGANTSAVRKNIKLLDSIIIEEDIKILYEIINKKPQLIDDIINKITIVDKLDYSKESNVIFSKIKIEFITFESLALKTTYNPKIPDNIFYKKDKIILFPEIKKNIGTYIKRECKIFTNFLNNIIDTDIYIIRNTFKFDVKSDEKIYIYYI